MATFELKSNLPEATQNEIDRVKAISSALRTTSETNFYNALLPYFTNVVVRYDADDLILEAEGNTLPTGYSGFKQGGLFRKLDESGWNLYVNVGTSTDAVWNVITGTAVASSSPSASVSPSSSASSSPSASVSPSSSASSSTSASVSPSASESASSSASQSPSASPSPSSSTSASASPSVSPSPSFPAV